MYAVFCIKNKQYLVKLGEILYIDKINLNKNSTVEFNNLLLLYKDNKLIINKENLKYNKINALVIDHIKEKKIRVLKFKRRNNFLKINNHRQNYTKIKIIEII